jgi:hypothetical protein
MGNAYGSPIHHDDEHARGCQSSGETDAERASMAQRGLDLNIALEPLDISPHDIESHPSSGNIGHQRARGKSRRENQRLNLRRRHGGEFFRTSQAPLQGCELDALEVEATPIIGDLYDKVCRGETGSQADCAEAGLAKMLPLIWGFETVIDGIADHVHQRILHLFQDPLIGGSIPTFDDQLHFFRLVPRQISHHPRKELKDGG